MKVPVWFLIALVLSLAVTPAQAVTAQPPSSTHLAFVPFINVYPHAVAWLTILTPDGEVLIPLSGSAEEWLNTTLAGAASDTDFDGLEQITTQLGALNLNGSSTLGAVQVTLRSSSLSPYQSSIGQMEEQANNTPDVLDLNPFTPAGSVNSFFDVFLEVTIAGIVYHNELPWQISGVFYRAPYLPGEDYLNVGDVQLYDSSNEGSRYILQVFHYIPNPWLVMMPFVVR